MAFRVGNLVSLVTGGGAGLGRAVVERFARQGGRVAILDLPSSKGQEVADELGAAHCLFCPADVTNTEDVVNAIEATKSKFGPMQVLVNCAGIAPARKVYNHEKKKIHSLEEFQKALDINVAGTFDVIRNSVPVMAEVEKGEDGQRGVIINTSSIAAYDGQAGQSAYSASKGAIAGFTLPLARDLSRIGIRVVTIAPGPFKTQLFDNLPEKAVKSLEASVPFPQRLGNPEEYAMLVQSIVENTMLNGEVIRLDGALRMT